MSEDVPAFDVPDRPTRRFTATGSVKYEGETVFSLTPDPDRSAGDLEDLVVTVLDRDRYVAGDWFDLPRPVYLVHDHRERTSFRVVVRSGRIELHLLPDTEASGLRAFYEGLVTNANGLTWTVECAVNPP